MKRGVRIIGGKYRGKKIPVPEREGLRPTSNRMRETLFNWLMHDLSGARCLDAFAGSGALGFEAASRGACEVIMLERDPRAATALKKIAAELDDKTVMVQQRDALQYLDTAQSPFDIVFLDPPFALNYWHSCLAKLVKNRLLRKGAKVYVESPQELDLQEDFWQCLKLKKSGQVIYALYQALTY